MADIRYDVSQLFKAIFGINNPIYITEPLQKSKKPQLDFQGVATLEEFSKSSYSSWMGTPIMFAAQFVGNEYRIYNTLTGAIETVKKNNWHFPAATVFSFRRAKNITRTNVLGSNGTVKEIFGFDDWIIDVKGLCLDEPNKSARLQLDELLQWEKLADAIQISGELFSMIELRRVCINDFSYNIPQGSTGVIAFEMQLYGDEPIEFEL